MIKSIFKTNSLDVVINTISENVDWFFGDMDGQGIGSSDITVCVKAVLGDLCNDANIANYDRTEISMIRNAISNAICDL